MNIFEFNEKLTPLKNTASALRGKTMVQTPHGKGRVHGYVVIGYTLEAAEDEILLFSEDGPYDRITLAQANSLLNDGMVDLGQYSVSLWDTDRFASEMAEVRERFDAACKALTGRVIRFIETMHDDANGENVEVHDTFIAEAIISPSTQPGEIPDELELHTYGGSLGDYTLYEANALLRGETVPKSSWEAKLVDDSLEQTRDRLVHRKIIHEDPSGRHTFTIKDVKPWGCRGDELLLELLDCHGGKELLPLSKVADLLAGKLLVDINCAGEIMFLVDTHIGECYSTDAGVFRVTDCHDGKYTIAGVEYNGEDNPVAYVDRVNEEWLLNHGQIPIGVYMEHEAAVMEKLMGKLLYGKLNHGQEV